jgi:iron(III) transport system substrate-binding protein
MRSGGLRVLLTTIVMAGVIASGGCGGKDSSNQREVVVYCSVDQEVAEPIFREFTRLTGVKVLARYDSESSKTVGLIQRLRAEQADPVADVLWSSEVFDTIALARDGMLSSYQSSVTSAWPKEFTGDDGLWHGFALRGRVIVYNTARVPADQVPARLEDLLDGRWKGRLVMARPHAGTTRGEVASWFAHYGPERATEILQGLKANGIRLVDGNSLVVRSVKDGEADVGLTDTDDVYNGQRNGWPVAMAPLNQGGDGALAIPNTVALIRGAPHPRPAAQLIDFLLSEKVEAMLAESDFHSTPVRPDLAEKFPQYRVEPRLRIDYSTVTENLPNALKAGEVLN